MDETIPDKPFNDTLEPDWSKDSRCKTYWNVRGRVFRAYPLNKTHVMLVDINAGLEIKMTNSEVRFEENQGNLVEIDPFQSMVLFTGGRTAARKTTPEKESSLEGKYGKTTLQGKYAAKKGDTDVSIIKRLLEEGKKVVPPKEEEEVKELKTDKPASSVVGKYARKTAS